MQPLILDLDFWHRSFLTTIITHALFEFLCDCMQHNKDVHHDVCIKAYFFIFIYFFFFFFFFFFKKKVSFFFFFFFFFF